MSTGTRYWTAALAGLLCLLAAAGCRKKSSRHVTINNSSDIFTTDNFPGAPVQDGNVADDKRAFSEALDGLEGVSDCTHNGERGTMMVSYRIEGSVYTHYYDGESWSPGVALRHSDADTGGSFARPDIVHAFINTAEDDREAARERDGDCLIFWVCRDADSDGGGADGGNTVLYVSTFDVTYAGDAAMNYGFDIDPARPGVFEARRLSVADGAGENVTAVGVATDGLCGEARWRPGSSAYRYGDATTGIVAFWHQLREKSPGIFDDTTEAAAFDLGGAGDPAVPPAIGGAGELAPVLFGCSDAGMSCRESVAGDEYASYNGVMFRRVRTAGAFPHALPASHWGMLDFDQQIPPFAGEDLTLQATHFNLLTGAETTTVLNTVLPDSSAGNVDHVGCDYVRQEDVFDNFLARAGQGVYGRDEGLSCLVTFFGEVATADATAVVPWVDEGGESGVGIAAIDEASGALLGSARVSADDPAGASNVFPSRTLSTRIGRNGDYIWAVWYQEDAQGGVIDAEIFAAQFLTTRVDGDGLPVAVPSLAATIGAPISVSDAVFDPYLLSEPAWYLWQDNLGYRCGQQSDARVMNLFFYAAPVAVPDDFVYHVRLTADVDGTLGGETASAPALIVTDDADSVHAESLQSVVNEVRSTFNATDAGRDGDVLYAFAFDGDESDGTNEQHIFAGRLGVTAAPAVEIGSRTGNRQVAYARPIRLVGTPAGEEIGAWDAAEGAYGDGAHHGAEFVHVLFQEAETGSLVAGPGALGSTLTGFALRTRTYRCADADASIGDDFTPSAGAPFAPPFDIDLPFIDPDTGDDLSVLAVLKCDNGVVVLFQEDGHLYYQECDPGDGDGEVTGWRQSAAGISDPALIDDDLAEPVSGVELISSPTCGCCTIDGTAIFWIKPMGDGGKIERAQVRVIDRDR